MEIGAVGFSPYVYRVNAVSASSLNRVSPIGEDLLASKTDFTGLVADERSMINPLKRGETANFADVLAMQFQMGRMNAERLFHGSASEKNMQIRSGEKEILSEMLPESEDDMTEEKQMAFSLGKATESSGMENEHLNGKQAGASFYQAMRATRAYKAGWIA